MDRKTLQAFYLQWRGAEWRGIEFKFEYDEWVKWWVKHLGQDWFTKRGRAKGKYCMSRKYDKGPYSWRNVECKLFEVNCRDKKLNGTSARGVNHGHASITDAIACEIFKSKETHALISKRLGVSRSIIRAIRAKKTWRHVTKGLRCGCAVIKLRKITREEAINIFLHPGSYGEIRRKFRRSYVAVQKIKTRKRFAKWTKGLKKPPDNLFGQLGGHALRGKPRTNGVWFRQHVIDKVKAKQMID